MSAHVCSPLSAACMLGHHDTRVDVVCLACGYDVDREHPECADHGTHAIEETVPAARITLAATRPPVLGTDADIKRLLEEQMQGAA